MSEQGASSVCPHCGAAETYRKEHKDGRSTVVYACDTALSVSGKHHRSKACMQAEIERLKTIVRVRTHREHGCICEKCVESEHDVARVVAALRAELDANGRDSCKLAGDVWRAHRNGMLADCDDCPYSTPVFVQAWWLGYGQTAAEQRWYDLRVGMVAELDAVRSTLKGQK